jgi:hypothetical protein
MPLEVPKTDTGRFNSADNKHKKTASNTSGLIAVAPYGVIMMPLMRDTSTVSLVKIPHCAII